MYASNVMERDVVACGPNETLESAAMMMWKNDCGAVVVVDESGAPVGIVTDRDIAMSCALNHKAMWDLSMCDVTNNRTLYTCNENDDMSDALQTMGEHKIRRLLVTNTEGKLQGIISIGDIVAFAGGKKKDLSYQTTMKTLKAVCIHH